MKKISATFLLIFLLILAGCSQSSQSGESQTASTNTPAEEKKSDFPNKPIELIVPYDAGGGTDVNARILANGVNKHLPNGQSIVVVNKPGGQGTVGMTEVAKAKPDGYTIAFTSVSPLTVNPHIMQTAYTPGDFQTIMGAYKQTQVLFVQKDSPWKTFEEWLTFVKQNPGKFNYGTNGAGSTAHLAMETLNVAEGLETKHVPFKGAAPALTALLGGHVQGTFIGTTQSDISKLQPLANFGSTRNEFFKDVPTLKELGIDVAVDLNNGVLAPKGLPEDVAQILGEAFKKALEDPEVTEQFKKVGVETSYASPADFEKEILDSHQVNGEIIKKVGLSK